MTDGKLIENAAKAAGYQRYTAAMFGKYSEMYDPNFEGLYCVGGHYIRWEPLIDDGDALRLAVKLQLTVANEHVSAGVAYCTDVDDNVFQVVRSGGNQSEVIAEDYAATRRAIVKAAAAIGETL